MLVQPFLSFDAGGTARVRPDGGIDVAVAPGGPTGVVGGRRGGRDVRVEADGTIGDEQELGGIGGDGRGGGRASRGAPPRPSAPP